MQSEQVPLCSLYTYKKTQHHQWTFCYLVCTCAGFYYVKRRQLQLAKGIFIHKVFIPDMMCIHFGSCMSSQLNVSFWVTLAREVLNTLIRCNWLPPIKIAYLKVFLNLLVVSMIHWSSEIGSYRHWIMCNREDVLFCLSPVVIPSCGGCLSSRNLCLGVNILGVVGGNIELHLLD